jgi:hypothetical protein
MKRLKVKGETEKGLKGKGERLKVYYDCAALPNLQPPTFNLQPIEGMYGSN